MWQHGGGMHANKPPTPVIKEALNWAGCGAQRPVAGERYAGIPIVCSADISTNRTRHRACCSLV